MRVGYTGPVTAATDALAAAGAACRAAPELDVRDEALELTRRYWRRERLTGAENVRFLENWDDFRRRLLVATADLDVVITPATAEPAPPWRESTVDDYRWTLPWSLTGAPVVVVPVGVEGGLPVAVQVIAQPWRDHVALAAAHLIETAP